MAERDLSHELGVVRHFPFGTRGLGARDFGAPGTPKPEAFTRLNRAVVASKLRVPVYATFPLDQVAKAHQLLEKGHVLGKIVLR